MQIGDDGLSTPAAADRADGGAKVVGPGGGACITYESVRLCVLELNQRCWTVGEELECVSGRYVALCVGYPCVTRCRRLGLGVGGWATGRASFVVP